jgi:hypothetical protein
MSEECTMEEHSEVSHHHGQPNGNERRLAAVERDVAVIRSNYATREDVVRFESKVQDRLSSIASHVNEMENRLVRWIFGTFVALAAIAFTAGKFM